MKVNSATKKKLIDIGIDEFNSHELARGRVWSEIVELSSGQIENICSVPHKVASLFHDFIQEKRKKEKQEFGPLVDGSWPEIDIDDTESQLLAKYSDDELIMLASLNPGYGYREFMKQLYPKGGKTSQRNTTVMRYLKEIVNEDGTNYYDLLQDPSKISWATKAEYKRITGNKYLPKGFASRGSAGGKKSKLDSNNSLVPLPPQNFDWGDITPGYQRDSYHYGRFGNAAPMLLNIKFDLARIWQYYEDGFTIGEVSREMMIPYQHANKWTNKLIEYDKIDVLSDWLELVTFLNDISTRRGNETVDDERNDEIYMFIRKITRSYLIHPEKWVSRPSLESLAEILHELEGITEADIEPVNHSFPDSMEVELIGNQIDHKFNFRIDKMVSNGFFSPIVEQIAQIQIRGGASSLSVCCGSSVEKEKITGLVNALVGEYDCKILIASDDRELIEHCKQSVNNANLILRASSLTDIDTKSDVTWILSPPKEVFDLDPQLYKFNQLDYFNQLLSEMSSFEPSSKIWLQPVFEGFLSRRALTEGSGSVDASEVSTNSSQDFFHLVRILSTYGYRVVADCQPALACLSSADSVKERLSSKMNEICLKNGAKGLFVDINLQERTFPRNEELDLKIDELIEGSGIQLLEDYTPFIIEI